MTIVLGGKTRTVDRFANCVASSAVVFVVEVSVFGECSVFSTSRLLVPSADQILGFSFDLIRFTRMDCLVCMYAKRFLYLCI